MRSPYASANQGSAAVSYRFLAGDAGAFESVGACDVSQTNRRMGEIPTSGRRSLHRFLHVLGNFVAFPTGLICRPHFRLWTAGVSAGGGTSYPYDIIERHPMNPMFDPVSIQDRTCDLPLDTQARAERQLWSMVHLHLRLLLTAWAVCTTSMLGETHRRNPLRLRRA